jgi:two-component system sensor histidine kinase ChiS
VRTRLAQFAIVIFLTISAAGVGAQNVVKGHADLSSYDFSVSGKYELWGEWEFYWNKLLTPQDFSINQSPEWFWPYGWNRQSEYPALGYATYRLRLTLPTNQRGLILFFPVINSSAKIWLNGQLVLESGRLSINRNDYRPELSSSLISIPDGSPTVELIIQVANWTYFSGGLFGSAELNTSDATFDEVNRRNGVENFFAGSLIAMFLYQVILFFLYDRGKAHLWLALICLGVALRSLIVHGGSFLLPNLFPGISWEIWKKIEFGSVYAIEVFFPLYVYHLFIGSAPRKPLYFFATISIGLVTTVLFTPQYVYGPLLEICHVGLLSGFIYAVYSIGKAWRHGNKDARVIFFGVLASFPFILAEILKNSHFFPVNIPFMYLVEMGVLIFLLFQVYLLANHVAKSYKNLESLNQTLEKTVEERTEQLVTANTVKDRLLSVMSHDIKSPLNSLKGVLNIYNKGAISKDEFSTLTMQIENDLSKTSMLVENILHWTASQIKGVQLKPEKFNLFELVEDTIRLFDSNVLAKKISIHHNVLPKTDVTSERNILTLVLRNLLSNAIKFSPEGGKITVEFKTGNSVLELRVKDDGVGMNSETVQSLMSSNNAVSTLGTGNEKGTGLGISLCREYVNSAGGGISVESAPGKGTTFIVVLPVGKP